MCFHIQDTTNNECFSKNSLKSSLSVILRGTFKRTGFPEITGNVKSPREGQVVSLKCYGRCSKLLSSLFSTFWFCETHTHTAIIVYFQLQTFITTQPGLHSGYYKMAVFLSSWFITQAYVVVFFSPPSLFNTCIESCRYKTCLSNVTVFISLKLCQNKMFS